ncbi:hypothetical protein CN138_18155 [Sinorhizobium meliloti]|nr:hypothetical protein CN164_25735 [Sinorhizobium meliloti]RVL50737.1 hypothetical protein CN145_17630 [Sinorhizobium meliloti]RVL69702.1 hypothetical protein CN138_18155 [Sinorhizobium meliloti]RVM31676.1 hypothetical protein CN130_16220 [Sinorhizobium meliloti]RVP62782.1 hypothetical protein CN076_06020 [Sinorhizobium meliloti]
MSLRTPEKIVGRTNQPRSSLPDALRLRPGELHPLPVRDASVALSAAGVQFLSEIAPDLQTIENAIEHIGEHSSRPSGRLRLNMAPGIARMLLEPLLLEYGRRYPEVELEVVSEKGSTPGYDLLSDFARYGGHSDHPTPFPGCRIA